MVWLHLKHLGLPNLGSYLTEFNSGQCLLWYRLCCLTQHPHTKCPQTQRLSFLQYSSIFCWITFCFVYCTVWHPIRSLVLFISSSVIGQYWYPKSTEFEFSVGSFKPSRFVSTGTKQVKVLYTAPYTNLLCRHVHIQLQYVLDLTAGIFPLRFRIREIVIQISMQRFKSGGTGLNKTSGRLERNQFTH